MANERPKKLWLRELSPKARAQLRAPQVPQECRAGLIAPPSGVLPVTQPQMKSLLDVFRRAPDPRDSNTQYRTGPVLTLIAMALLAGRRDIAEIARFATTLRQPQRRQLGLPRKAGTRAFYKIPGYGVFYALLTRMEPEPFAALLERLPALDGKIITADALHCQRASASAIVEKGGDYLVQIKGNQPRLLKQARALDALVGTPFLSRPNAGTAASKSAPSMPSPSNR